MKNQFSAIYSMSVLRTGVNKSTQRIVGLYGLFKINRFLHLFGKKTMRKKINKLKLM